MDLSKRVINSIDLRIAVARSFVVLALVSSILATNATSTWANSITVSNSTKANKVLKPIALQVASLSLVVGTSQVSPGGQTSVTITIRDQAGQPVSNVPVSLFSSWGDLSISHGLSNSSGQVTAIFTAGSRSGSGIITAISGYASQSVSILIQESNSPPIGPHTPQPVDGTTNLAIAEPLTLNWQGGDTDGDQVAYILALGQVNPPPVVANSIMPTTFELKLSSAGTYYWAVTATDGRHSTSGPVWSFTLPLTSPPPYLPFNPTPSDGAISIPLTQTLNWDVDAPIHETMTYTVAFGIINPPPLVATRTVTNYTPVDVVTGTTYYWMITATNGISTRVGPMWHFTTVGANNVTIYLPIILGSGDN